MKHVVIGIPSGDQVQADFAMALASMSAYSSFRYLDKFKIWAVCNEKGCLIAQSRNNLALSAIETKDSTHLLMIDSDMVFPPDSLMRLCEMNKPVAGIKASSRRAPLREIGEKINGKWQLGFGMILIDLKVFEKIPFPWFEVKYDAIKGWIGEDWDFCFKCWKHDVEIACDEELSEHIAHLGQSCHTLQTVRMSKQMRETAKKPVAQEALV